MNMDGRDETGCLTAGRVADKSNNCPQWFCGPELSIPATSICGTSICGTSICGSSAVDANRRQGWLRLASAVRGCLSQGIRQDLGFGLVAVVCEPPWLQSVECVPESP